MYRIITTVNNWSSVNFLDFLKIFLGNFVDISKKLCSKIVKVTPFAKNTN